MAENKGSCNLETKNFDTGFMRAANILFPDALSKGLFKAGAVWIKDAITEKPRAPHRLGALWRAQQIAKPDLTAREITVIAGFNIAYGAYQHEGRRKDGSHIVKWYSISRKEKIPASTADFGPKFLSSKAAKYGGKYLKIAADHCSDSVGGMK